MIAAAVILAAALAAAPASVSARTDDGARAIRAALDPRMPPAEDGDVARFYALHGRGLAWTPPRAAAAMEAMAQSAREGLSPENYRIEQPPRRPNAKAAAAWDMQLTRAFLRYARDVHGGRVVPDQVYDDISLPRDSFDAPAELDAALRAGTFAGFIAGLPPRRAEYAFLRQALAHYRALDARGAWTVPVRAGQPLTGLAPDVRDKLQLRLAADDPEAAGDTLSAPALREALRRFQARFGLPQTGTLTAETVTILRQPISHRVLQIEANMERWRWMPRVPDKRYVEVNTPDASLKIVEDGKALLTSPVILGRPDWATPILATAAQGVVINPPWHVPPDLAGEEILPHLVKDASYLATHNMVLLDGPAQDPQGRTIKWSEVPADPFPYRIQQKPGPRGGLGALLIDMPNDFGVYLHDTPDQQLFTRADRMLSHGCVRVRGIAAVASYALFGETKAADRMPRPPRTETQRMPLAEPLPVYMLYWTVFQDADGAIAFRRDVYGRDVRLIAALYGRPLAPAGPKAPATEVAQTPAP